MCFIVASCDRPRVETAEHDTSGLAAFKLTVTERIASQISRNNFANRPPLSFIFLTPLGSRTGPAQLLA